MLARVVAAAIVALVGLVVAPVPLAAAEGDGQCTQVVDPITNEVKWVCENGGGDPGGGGQNPGGGSSTCTYAGSEIPCSLGGGQWSSKNACYVIPTPVSPQPAPPPGQTDQDGDWHNCIQPAGYLGSNQPVWVEAGETLIDPAVLAQRAIAFMNLDPITIGIVPEPGPNRVGLVGLPVWMWVEDQAPNTYGPITASASQGPVSVTATAKVSSIVWDMGDGTKVTCTGPGTPYEDRYGKQDSPTCGHRYEQMSDDQPDDAYQVTATSHWVVEWSGGGQSGTIELDITTEPLPIRIGEAQVLTQ